VTLNQRDLALFADRKERGLYIAGEQERKEFAEKQLGSNWRLFDFSGVASENASVGGGWMQEAARSIEQDMKQYHKRGIKVHVAGIFLDWLGQMAARYCHVHNLDLSTQLRYQLLSSIDEARLHLAYRFACPVVITHQVNRSAKALRAGVLADKSQSSECGSLSDNCDFVFVLSNSTKTASLARLECQKARRVQGLHPFIIQLQGSYSRIADVSSSWFFDTVSASFVPLAGNETSDSFQKNTEGTRTFKKSKPMNAYHFIQSQSE
jgi:hypothetical protein